MKDNIIVFGKYRGIQENAINYLSELIFDYTGTVPACVSSSEYLAKENARCFFVGTLNDNMQIKNISNNRLCNAEEYRIKITDGNVYIEGYDDGGVLYGCLDFYNEYLMKQEKTQSSDPYITNPFDSDFVEFDFSACPSVKNRGLWTWGHVVYNYRSYIKNMAMLKLNTLIIWNDHVPLNAASVIEYAHSYNIKLIWGYPWGWDTNCNEIDLASLEKYTENIVEYYEKNYADLGGDGIYFQSFTELSTDKIGDKLIAETVTDFVNKTAGILLDKHPDLKLLFGLHATSVKEKLEFIKNTDKRIHIIWENCGAFPYDYLPQNVENFAETLDFTTKIFTLRGMDEKAGVVLKGCTKLDWSKFVHQQGSYCLGQMSDEFIEKKASEKKDIWRYVQAFWLRNADKVYETIKTIHDISNGDTYITALVEDGAFEKNIYFQVALLSNMLFDCNKPYEDIISDTAQSKYVVFA
ncbi:MAG: hypothetical protein E7656_00410 [Ruminococcaceae bacterium]|nr:hypothetical protein [Oscillospiraceae bacterium]